MFENTISFINKLNSTLDSQNPNQTDKDFVATYELEFVKNLFLDLGNDSLQRIGKVLVALSECSSNNQCLCGFYNLPN